MKEIKAIAFTHKTVGLENLGALHIEEDLVKHKLSPLMGLQGIEEIMLISTCNRVEYLIVSDDEVDVLLNVLFENLYGHLSKETSNYIKSRSILLSGEGACQHLFEVASSLDSLVVGEREIITQVRNAYDRCKLNGLTGDKLRLLIRKTIETAKQVYTETEIANRPVSVVNLAYRKLRSNDINEQSTILVVGAGKTNIAMINQLKKHNIGKFVIFNRTLSKAQALATELNGEACNLSDLAKYKGKFDVILTCTGSSDKIITEEIYKQLIRDDKSKKVVVDLAVPNDFDEKICEKNAVDYISIKELKEIAELNLSQRYKEVENCLAIVNENLEEFKAMYQTRKVERAMQNVPVAVKEIKQRAFDAVFAKELEQLPEESKEVLNKVIAYMEKKYISMPMKMAKEIILNEISKK